MQKVVTFLLQTPPRPAPLITPCRGPAQRPPRRPSSPPRSHSFQPLPLRSFPFPGAAGPAASPPRARQRAGPSAPQPWPPRGWTSAPRCSPRPAPAMSPRPRRPICRTAVPEVRRCAGRGAALALRLWLCVAGDAAPPPGCGGAGSPRPGRGRRGRAGAAGGGAPAPPSPVGTTGNAAPCPAQAGLATALRPERLGRKNKRN